MDPGVGRHDAEVAHSKSAHAHRTANVSSHRALRAAGHDVAAVAEGFSGADDEVVLDIATREDRIRLTEDKDFGQLVYAHQHPSGGVMFMRFPAHARGAQPRVVQAVVDGAGDRLIGAFAVVQPGRTRIGPRRAG